MTENIVTDQTYAFAAVSLDCEPLGEKTRLDVDYYALLIRASWQKTTNGIFETAELVAQAVENLHGDMLKKLHERLPFTGSTFMADLASVIAI